MECKNKKLFGYKYLSPAFTDIGEEVSLSCSFEIIGSFFSFFFMTLV